MSQQTIRLKNVKLFFVLCFCQVMNSAIAQFCLEVIAKHGDPAPRLCNKDPLTLKMGSYVIELFPNVSQFYFENLFIFFLDIKKQKIYIHVNSSGKIFIYGP